MDTMSYNQVAQEGLFTKKKSVDDLLATAQKKISKMKTMEEVNTKLQAVNESGKAVNTALRTMSDAAKKRSAGKMDDKEFKSAVASASKSVASPIKALYAKLGNVVENKNSVTSDEIKAFQSYLSGLKKLLLERKKALKSAPASESFESTGDPELDAILESLEAELEDDDIALEGCKKKCKATESDDEDCDPDDEDCDSEDEDEEDDDTEDDEDEEDEEDDDDAEEACKESFTSDELDEYASACESMMNDEFDCDTVEESFGSDILNSDGTLDI